MSHLTPSQRKKMDARHLLTYLAFPLMAPLMVLLFYGLGYRISDIRKVRSTFKEIRQRYSNCPTLVCLNHITRIDSVLLAVALMPGWKFFFHYSSLPWHVLEKSIIRFLPLRCIAFISKTLPIIRMGDRDQVQLVQEKVKYLLNKGELVVIFPEGKRSMDARIDAENFQYGVGSIVMQVPGCHVLCAYVRGNKQVARSDIPAFGSKIHIDLEMIKPSSQYSGLRGARDIAGQIIAKLQQQESAYFSQYKAREPHDRQ